MWSIPGLHNPIGNKVWLLLVHPWPSHSSRVAHTIRHMVFTSQVQIPSAGCDLFPGNPNKISHWANPLIDDVCFRKSQVFDRQREANVIKYLFSRHHHVSISSWYNAEQSGSCSFQQTRFSRHDGLHSLLEVRRRLRSGMMYIRSSGGANDYQCDKHTTHWYGECSPNQQNNRMLNKNYSCHCG